MLGDAGVCGLDGGVMGLWKRRDAGDPSPGWPGMKESMASMPTVGDGGLSSSVADLRRVWLLITVSSTKRFRNVCGTDMAV